jgi:hypothetical protein
MSLGKQFSMFLSVVNQAVREDASARLEDESSTTLRNVGNCLPKDRTEPNIPEDLNAQHRRHRNLQPPMLDTHIGFEVRNSCTSQAVLIYHVTRNCL